MDETTVDATPPPETSPTQPSPTTEEDQGGIFAQRAAKEVAHLSGKVVDTDKGLRLEILKLAAQHDTLGTPTSTVNAAEAYWKWMTE